MPPTRLVVDSSVGAKWVFPEPDSLIAVHLLQGYVDGQWELMVPDIYLAQIANIGWKKCRLRGETTEAETARALRLILQVLPTVIPTAPLVGQALELSLTYGRPVEDCLYVALALQQGSLLVTADKSLTRGLGPALGVIVDLDRCVGWWDG